MKPAASRVEEEDSSEEEGEEDKVLQQILAESRLEQVQGFF